MNAAETPLYVALDGTLIKTDLLFEGTVRILRQQPGLFLVVPPLRLLTEGKAAATAA